jgi:hypothetical protein
VEAQRLYRENGGGASAPVGAKPKRKVDQGEIIVLGLGVNVRVKVRG